MPVVSAIAASFSGLVALLAGHEDVRVAVEGTADSCRDVDADVAVVGLAGLGIDAATRTVGRVRGRSDTRLAAVIDGVEDVLGWVAAARVDACLDLGTVALASWWMLFAPSWAGGPSSLMELLSALRERESATAPGLTLMPRERDVLALRADGQSNKSIARLLEFQVGTVSVYVCVILAKLGMVNRTEARR